MNTAWRYFDYDYDNNMIIMTDESDSNIGWVSTKEIEDTKDCDADCIKYPVSIADDQSVLTTITVCIIKHYSQ